ncbi:MAG: outer membrane protein transport protein [Thermoanaerobaculales bacterium]|jgi:long-chain fatty acid transport protein|nr:outer membrane protein transport protein [Thermoanaerobaculales bacterium]
MNKRVALMRGRGTVLLASLVVGSVLVAFPARAGGLYANEYGTPEMGTAGAGAEASALDASTAIPFYNPAGMTLLEGDQLLVAAGALLPDIQFAVDPATTFSGGDGGQAGNPVPILTAAYVHSFGGRFRLGLSLYGAAGAALEYDPDWVGRRQAQTSEILALSLSPTVAYRVNEWLSVGGGLNIVTSMLEVRVEGLIPGSQIAIDGTDTQVSFNLSAMLELGERSRIGVSYVSETELDYSGDVTRTPRDLTAPVNTTLTLPDVLRVGLHHDVSDSVAIVGTVGWENWSALENQYVSVGQVGTATLPRNWDDTYRFGAGLHYRLGDPWLLRFGVTYDTSPTDADDRTADLPVDRQIRVAAGVQNQRGDRFSWGAQLVYADLGDAEIDSSGVLGNLVGSYSSNAYLGIAGNLQWRF